MFVKRIGYDKLSSLTSKHIWSNQPKQDKIIHPPFLSDNDSHNPALDLSIKDKSIDKDFSPVDFTNVAHIYCPVKKLTIKELKRAPAISGIEHGSQEY